MIRSPSFVSMLRKTNYWIVLLALVAGSLVATVIPPLQSPDEADHIKRAYLLGSGIIILDAPPGLPSGGMIDTGLLEYLDFYHLTLGNHRDRRLTLSEAERLHKIRWTGQYAYSPAPGTGYYFPLVYLPQTIGLKIGEQFGMSIDTSYELARFLSLCFVIAALALAFSLFPTNPLVLALLVLPMSVFQFASASLDGASTALSVLSIAAFLRISQERERAASWLFYMLSLLILLLATSRVNLAPLLALVFVSVFYTRRKGYFLVFAISTLLALAWTLVAVKTTVDPRGATGAPTLTIVDFYLQHPFAFPRTLFATLSNVDIANFYVKSFLGILGYLDSHFSENQYWFMWLCLGLTALLSISMRHWSLYWRPAALLLGCAAASVLIVFFALLITWNPHPAQIIQGVQGRYFLIPSLMVAYAIAADLKVDEGAARKLALALVFGLGAFTVFNLPPLVIKRYYLAVEQAPAVPIPPPAEATPN
jgi:uncharacterized membrane protein